MGKENSVRRIIELVLSLLKELIYTALFGNESSVKVWSVTTAIIYSMGQNES